MQFFEQAENCSMGLLEGSKCPFCKGELDCAQEGDKCLKCERWLSECPECSTLLTFIGCKDDDTFYESKDVTDEIDIIYTLWFCDKCKKYFSGSAD